MTNDRPESLWLAAGNQSQERGDLRQAESCYREALQLEPDLAEAHNGLGIALAQQGDLAGAEASFRQVVRLIPSAAQAHSNLGNVLKDQGRLAEAEACHREAMHWQPDDAGTLNNLGLVLAAQGRLADAEDCYRQALGRQPDFPAAHYNLGLVLIDQGRLDEAGARLQEALRLDFGNAEAHRALGTVLWRQGRAREAEARFRWALEIRPDFAEALYGCGQALQAQDRFAEAETCFQRVLQLRPNDAEVHYHLGVVSYRQGKFEEAKACFQRVLELSPNIAGVHIDLGNVWRDQGHLDEAHACFLRALQLEPDNAVAHNNLGSVLNDLGRLDEALASCRKAIEVDPQCTYAHHSLGHMLLLRGELEQGWQEFEWRWRCKLKLPALSIPYWDGTPLQGRTILLTEEQGLGDKIQFIRYAALLKQQEATVVFACTARLHEVLTGCPGIDRLVKVPGPAGPCDWFAPLLSLPRLLGTTLDTIPASIPYLFPLPERFARWQQELSGVAGFKIGICWQGSPGNQSDRRRSVRLEQFAPLARLSGVRLCSLQLGPGRDQLAALADRFLIMDLGGRFDSASLGDAAAVVKCLDLVITVDTAAAHLAGALGVPVWVALPYVPDWRWFLEREDSPWYPTMRLFRQSRPGDWASVFQRIAAELKAQKLPAAGPPA
jgi:tetratricopeptide (TPR) repeat protein